MQRITQRRTAGPIVGLMVLAMTGWAIAPTAEAQRDPSTGRGLARQRVMPTVAALSGTVVEVRTESGAMTTGHGRLGSHLLMRQDEGGMLNVYLGPVEAVEDAVQMLDPGVPVQVQVFRARHMPASHYIAQTVTVDDRTVTLRDESLQPRWADSAKRGGRRMMRHPRATTPRHGGMHMDQGMGMMQRHHQAVQQRLEMLEQRVQQLEQQVAALHERVDTPATPPAATQPAATTQPATQPDD